MKRFLYLILPFLGMAAHAADVEITVNGVHEVRGKLKIGIYNNPTDFASPDKALEASPEIMITEPGPVTIVVPDLEPGVYAVAVIWDWNDNDVLDHRAGPFEIPTEPYAFSNNPKLRFGPPKFEDCHFRVEEPGGRLLLELSMP